MLSRMKNRICLVMWIACFAFCGCGGSTDNPAPSGKLPQNSAGVAPTGVGMDHEPASKNASVTAAGQVGRDVVRVDENGQKWLGNIPYDVFFDSPSLIAADQTPLATAAAASSGSQSSADATASTPVSPLTESSAAPQAQPEVASAAATGWDSLITVDVLENEIKELRNSLQQSLQSVGNYNSSMLSIPAKVAALGTLAGIAMQHPGDVTWKEDAAYIRDLTRQMNETQLQRGAKDQKRLLRLYENITDIFNRSRPADLPAPPESQTFSDVAELRLVMMRMEEAEKKLRTEVGGESGFASKKVMILHEAGVLGAMTHLATLSDYGYADDPEFVGFGTTIETEVRKILTAAESGDFEGFELSLSNVSGTCQACHSKYKND